MDFSHFLQNVLSNTLLTRKVEQIFLYSCPSSFIWCAILAFIIPSLSPSLSLPHATLLTIFSLDVISFQLTLKTLILACTPTSRLHQLFFSKGRSHHGIMGSLQPFFIRLALTDDGLIERNCFRTEGVSLFNLLEYCLHTSRTSLLSMLESVAFFTLFSLCLIIKKMAKTARFSLYLSHPSLFTRLAVCGGLGLATMARITSPSAHHSLGEGGGEGEGGV